MKNIVEVLRDEFDKQHAPYKLSDEQELAYRKFVHVFAKQNNIKLIGRLIDNQYWATDCWEGYTTEDAVIFKLKFM